MTKTKILTKYEALAKISKDGMYLKRLSDEFKNDKNIVLAAVEQNARALQYAGETLKNSREFILDIVTKNGLSLQYASAELRNDKNLVLWAVKNNGHALLYASLALRNDKEVVVAALRQNGYVLKYASASLKRDKSIVLAAVNQYAYAFRFVGNKLKNDIEVVIATLVNHSDGLQLKMNGYGNNKPILNNLSPELRNNPITTFITQTYSELNQKDQAIVKRALLEKPEYFLNPEPYMLALTAGMDNPYLMLAQYALGKDVIIEPEALPTIEF